MRPKSIFFWNDFPKLSQNSYIYRFANFDRVLFAKTIRFVIIFVATNFEGIKKSNGQIISV